MKSPFWVTDHEAMSRAEQRYLSPPEEGPRMCLCGHDYDDHDVDGGRTVDDVVTSPCAFNAACDCHDFEVPDPRDYAPDFEHD